MYQVIPGEILYCFGVVTDNTIVQFIASAIIDFNGSPDDVIFRLWKVTSSVRSVLHVLSFTSSLPCACLSKPYLRPLEAFASYMYAVCSKKTILFASIPSW